MEKSTCKTCNKEFKYYRSTLRGKTGKFCSRACIVLIPHNKGKIVWKECLTCDSPVRAWRKYCSAKCVKSDATPLLKWFAENGNAFQGKHHTEEFKKKRSGDNHWNWKNGVTSLTSLERRKFNIEVGKMVFERDNYTCQLCGLKKDLQVDHIQSWAEYIELRFSIDNCRTLCRSCHYHITYGREMPKDSNWGIYASLNPFGKEAK